MRSIGFHNFQQCCFRLPDRWSNSTHWMGRLFVAIFFITMTSQWARWRLKSPVSRLFTQPFIQAQIKENIKALRHWPLWGEFTDDRWIPPQRASDAEMFPFDDVIMWWFTLIPFASWFLLPALPLNFALSCSENGLVPQERIKTIFSQNKHIFKQKMSLKMVSAKYRPFVGTGATYTISLEICTQIGCALFCCGHSIIDSWHTFLLPRFIVGFNSLVPGGFEFSAANLA